MKKNTSGQVIGAQIITIADGSAFSGTVTVYLTLDDGTQTIGTQGSGITTHKGRGYHTYLPSQAETNGNFVSATFTGTGAYPVTISFPTSIQTGDAYARLGPPVLSTISLDIQALFSTAMTESYNADGSPPTPAQALFVIMQLLTEMNIVGTTVTVKKLDGATTAYTLTINNATNPTAISRTT